jgi:hypothetical protein
MRLQALCLCQGLYLCRGLCLRRGLCGTAAGADRSKVEHHLVVAVAHARAVLLSLERLGAQAKHDRLQGRGPGTGLTGRCSACGARRVRSGGAFDAQDPRVDSWCLRAVSARLGAYWARSGGGTWRRCEGGKEHSHVCFSSLHCLPGGEQPGMQVASPCSFAQTLLWLLQSSLHAQKLRPYGG